MFLSKLESNQQTNNYEIIEIFTAPRLVISEQL